MLTVHHLNNSRSQRIIWLLEELAVSYDIKKYQRLTPVPLAPPELKAVHPLGKAPVICDGDLTIAESGAIIDYIIDTYGAGRLKPARGGKAYWEYQHWMHFAEGSAMLPFIMALYSSMMGDAMAMLKPRIEGEITNHLTYMEQALGDRLFFVGNDLTGADIQLLFVLEIAGLRLNSFPALANYRQRLQARPAYLRAIERGGPYALMGR